MIKYIMVLLLLNKVRDQALIPPREEEVQAAHGDVLEVGLVHVERATHVGPEHLHVVLIFEGVEQLGIKRIKLGADEEHARRNEPEGVFVAASEGEEELGNKLRLVHQAHSTR